MLALSGLCFYAYAADSGVPVEWVRINAKGFSFLAPTAMKAEDVKGTDSHVGRYTSSQMRIEFDYGRYSSNLDGFKGRPDYQETITEIGGKKAKVAAFSKIKNVSTENLRQDWVYLGGTGAYFGNVRKGSKLSVVVHCKNDEDLDAAKKIIYSIEFDDK